MGAACLYCSLSWKKRKESSYFFEFVFLHFREWMFLILLPPSGLFSTLLLTDRLSLTQHGYMLTHKQSISTHKHAQVGSTCTKVSHLFDLYPWWWWSFSTSLKWVCVSMSTKKDTFVCSFGPCLSADIVHCAQGSQRAGWQEWCSLCWQPSWSWWTRRVSTQSALRERRRWPLHGRLSANHSLDKYTVRCLANCLSMVRVPLSPSG